MTDTAGPGLLPLGGEIKAFHLIGLDGGGWQVVIDGTGGDQLRVGPFTGHDDVLRALAHIEGVCRTAYHQAPAD